MAIYRDNSKRSQPLSAAGNKKEEKKVAAAEPEQRELFPRAQREKLPVERLSVTHKFSVGGHEGYITVGMYPDGRPGEIFIKMSKEGSTLSGVMDGLALTLSIGLQYGVPLKVLVDKLVNTRFEPSGITANSNIRFATSVLDYIARWLGGRSLVGLSEESEWRFARRRNHRGFHGQRAANVAGDKLSRATGAQQFTPRRPRGYAHLLGMRNVDGTERGLLQMRKLRQYQWLQLIRLTHKERSNERTPERNSTGSQEVAQPAKGAGFLHIVRHGAGLSAFYIVTYHRLDRIGARPKAMLAEGAQSLIDLLERIGVDFRLREVRGALEDILRLGQRIFRTCG